MSKCKTPLPRKKGKKASGSVTKEFDACRVRPLPGQPRKRFRGIQELGDSIAEIGQITPGIVTLLKGTKDFDAQLIDGERRLRACKLVGVKFRAEVASEASIEENFARSFAANFSRQGHDPVEIAEALRRLKDAGRTVEKIAKLSGRSVPWVYQYLRILDLHPAIQKLMVPQDGQERAVLSMGHAMNLAALPVERQGALAAKLAGGISVHRLRKLIDTTRKADGLPRVGYSMKTVVKLTSLVERFLVGLSRYVDLPGVELNRLIDVAQGYQRRAAIDVLKKLSDDALGLASAVEARGNHENHEKGAA